MTRYDVIATALPIQKPVIAPTYRGAVVTQGNKRNTVINQQIVLLGTINNKLCIYYTDLLSLTLQEDQ